MQRNYAKSLSKECSTHAESLINCNFMHETEFTEVPWKISLYPSASSEKNIDNLNQGPSKEKESKSDRMGLKPFKQCCLSMGNISAAEYNNTEKNANSISNIFLNEDFDYIDSLANGSDYYQSNKNFNSKIILENKNLEEIPSISEFAPEILKRFQLESTYTNTTSVSGSRYESQNSAPVAVSSFHIEISSKNSLSPKKDILKSGKLHDKTFLRSGVNSSKDISVPGNLSFINCCSHLPKVLISESAHTVMKDIIDIEGDSQLLKVTCKKTVFTNVSETKLPFLKSEKLPKDSTSSSGTGFLDSRTFQSDRLPLEIQVNQQGQTRPILRASSEIREKPKCMISTTMNSLYRFILPYKTHSNSKLNESLATYGNQNEQGKWKLDHFYIYLPKNFNT